jgi:hypothetical protein
MKNPRLAKAAGDFVLGCRFGARPQDAPAVTFRRMAEPAQT